MDEFGENQKNVEKIENWKIVRKINKIETLTKFEKLKKKIDKNEKIITIIIDRKNGQNRKIDEFRKKEKFGKSAQDKNSLKWKMD